jgi:hypothetical protein
MLRRGSQQSFQTPENSQATEQLRLIERACFESTAKGISVSGFWVNRG